MATESLPLDKKSAKRLKAVLARAQHTINECECAIEELQEVASELWDASVDLDGLADDTNSSKRAAGYRAKARAIAALENKVEQLHTDVDDALSEGLSEAWNAIEKAQDRLGL